MLINLEYPLVKKIGSYKCDGVTYMEKEVLIQDPDGYLLRFSETQLEK